ncbi:ribosome-associated translation inhibitor RaiA [Aquimarina gracilis]|uniref:Ribosome-associated translation inhibitor RaiA n=1 Tax=Aquimarina gracilis TaxID=874422 RepID=A0ABU5ZVT1_9FLAO|nr:ribosome-associated translation inhibitor RaiA [Aquimarina gracilis]MEB3345966.1 ribosome-associated translation inhibitor RaiA [Aquimarina gracilis]
MKIIFEYTNVSASDRLEALAREKLESLERKYSFVHRGDVFFKKENTTSNEKGHHCGIRLSAPGPRIYAESDEASFVEAIAESIRDLEDQLRKRKEKMKTY